MSAEVNTEKSVQATESAGVAPVATTAAAKPTDAKTTSSTETKSTYEITAQMVVGVADALAWPLVLAMAVLVFRKSISTLLDRITKAEAFGAKFDFTKEISKIGAYTVDTVKVNFSAEKEENMPILAEVAKAEPPVAYDNQTDTKFSNLIKQAQSRLALSNFTEIASTDPRQAIIGSYAYAEEEYINLIRKASARKANPLPSYLVGTMSKLRKIKVAADLSANEPSAIDAKNFLLNVASFLRTMREYEVKLTKTDGDN